MITIPEDFTEFLYWVKERTEKFWSKDPSTSDDYYTCEEWAYGAKWIGLTDNEIDAAEVKYAIKFTPEHRAFLRILHTIDRHEIIAYGDGDEDISVEEKSLFYNWLEDDAEIKNYMDFPFRSICDEVTDNVLWLESWGVKPDSREEKIKIFTDWYNKTPVLIPLRRNQYLVSDMSMNPRPVLSLIGSDIIIYAWDFRTYLLRVLEFELGLMELVYDEGDKIWHSESKKEVLRNFLDDCKFFDNKDIPYWKEMILLRSSGSRFWPECPPPKL